MNSLDADIKFLIFSRVSAGSAFSGGYAESAKSSGGANSWRKWIKKGLEAHL